ncbi:DUF2971 domain-containing protein [Bradyrhizobium sp. dw_78]|uniref:DUF2971 domain-containing protein n=1 Tax=Bradyrhizobium sp. dw_78 TaxID=2719793 RepID=UPI001BD5D05C|nr:DUF2971 domain-containing protein [Bradyrhizobium sp. dw_78]
MGLANKYVSEIPDQFDLASILDPDVEKVEEAKYVAASIYKYFSSARREFFSRPQMRFSQKETLDDPREMSRRWKEARDIGLRKYIETGLRHVLPRVFNDKDVLLEKCTDYGEEELGRKITRSEGLHLEAILTSPAGHAFIHSQLEQAQQIIGPLLTVIFARLEADFDKLMEEISAKVGILSLTEDPLNEAMWLRYAESFGGFVVGLDSAHSFFFHSDKKEERSLLRKVIYTDEYIENFWRNPYYSFLVKNSCWEYQNEWRMLKRLSDCNERVDGTPPVCLWNLDPKMIKSIHFGYRYDFHKRTEDIANLQKVGADCDFYLVRPIGVTDMLEATRL